MNYAFNLPSEYSYVIGTGIASIFAMQYLGFKVGGARKKYSVEYPYLYADQTVASKDKDKYLFNCVQRGHQNALEVYPQFLMLLFVGGLKHPVAASVAGLIWLAGRIVYAAGYATGDPSQRQKGAFGYIGLLTLLGTSVSTALTIGRFI